MEAFRCGAHSSGKDQEYANVVSKRNSPPQRRDGAINDERAVGSRDLVGGRRRLSSLHLLLAPLLRVRGPLGRLSRRRRDLNLRQHLHAAVDLGDVLHHVVGDAALLRVLARVRRCHRTHGGRVSRCANGKPHSTLRAVCIMGKRAHPWARQQWHGRRVCQPAMGQPGLQEGTKQACSSRTRTSMILDSINLYSSGLEATLALSSAAKSGCAHRRARSHRTLWNQSTASRHGRPHSGAQMPGHLGACMCRRGFALACAGGEVSG